MKCAALGFCEVMSNHSPKFNLMVCAYCQWFHDQNEKNIKVSPLFNNLHITMTNPTPFFERFTLSTLLGFAAPIWPIAPNAGGKFHLWTKVGQYHQFMSPHSYLAWRGGTVDILWWNSGFWFVTRRILYVSDQGSHQWPNLNRHQRFCIFCSIIRKSKFIYQGEGGRIL